MLHALPSAFEGLDLLRVLLYDKPFLDLCQAQGFFLILRPEQLPRELEMTGQ